MAANPALLSYGSELYPQLYQGEIPVLSRPVDFEIDNVQTPTGSWKSSGIAHLSSYRIVFIASQPDPSGLHAFDLPLAFFRKEKVNQPILWGANNIAAEVWPLLSGPAGSEPPFHAKIMFPEGGFGTFAQLFLRMLETARNALYAEGGVRAAPSSGQVGQIMTSIGFFDPNDPTRVYVEKRTPPPPQQKDGKRLDDSYLYAREQDKDGESYQPMM